MAKFCFKGFPNNSIVRRDKMKNIYLFLFNNDMQKKEVDIKINVSVITVAYAAPLK